MEKNTCLTEKQIETLNLFLKKINAFQVAIPFVHPAFYRLKKIRRELDEIKTAVEDLLYANASVTAPNTSTLDFDLSKDLEKFKSSCLRDDLLLFKRVAPDGVIEPEAETDNIRSIPEALYDVWRDVCAAFGFKKEKNKYVMGVAEKETMNALQAIKTELIDNKGELVGEKVTGDIRTKPCTDGDVFENDVTYLL